MARPSRIEATEIAFGHSAELGEGSLWVTGLGVPGHESGAFLSVDIYGPSSLCAGPAVFVQSPYPGAPPPRVYPMPSFCGTVVPVVGGARALVALADGISELDLATGAVTRVCNPEATPETRWNDGKCSPEGRLWAGTMGAPGKVLPGVGGLFVLGPDRAAARVLSGVTISNGIAWAPDGRTMYYIDTTTGAVDAFDYDVATGAASNRRVAFAIPEGTGHPDGCCMDTEGNLWVAQWGGSRVVAYRPSDGSIVCTVMLPAAHVSSCAFGGPTMGDLYITTAKEHLTPEQRAAQPGAGNAFIVRNIGWTGMATNFFRDA